GGRVVRRCQPETRSLSLEPALNAGALLAAIWSSAPVCGLRPVRAARSRTSKVPKPGNETLLPLASSAPMASRTALTTLSAAACVMPASRATASTMTFLLMGTAFHRMDGSPHGRQMVARIAKQHARIRVVERKNGPRRLLTAVRGYPDEVAQTKSGGKPPLSRNGGAQQRSC